MREVCLCFGERCEHPVNQLQGRKQGQHDKHKTPIPSLSVACVIAHGKLPNITRPSIIEETFDIQKIELRTIKDPPKSVSQTLNSLIIKVLHNLKKSRISAC